MRQDEARETAWQALERHAQALGATPLKALFAADANRVGQFTRSACGITIDHSKQRVTSETLALFEALAGAIDLKGQLTAMRAGDAVNRTEG